MSCLQEDNHAVVSFLLAVLNIAIVAVANYFSVVIGFVPCYCRYLLFVVSACCFWIVLLLVSLVFANMCDSLVLQSLIAMLSDAGGCTVLLPLQEDGLALRSIVPDS